MTEHGLAAGNRGLRLVNESADSREFAALVDAYGASVLAMLRRLCGNCHDAEDVFQDTAVRVWRHSAGRPKLSNPRAWLMTVAYRAFLDHRKRRPRHEELDEKSDDRSVPPDACVEHAEDVERLNAAVAKLPEPIREVVVLHYSGGLSLRRTAEAMEISEGTVKSRLNAALKQLRSLMQ